MYNLCENFKFSSQLTIKILKKKYAVQKEFGVNKLGQKEFYVVQVNKFVRIYK